MDSSCSPKLGVSILVKCCDIDYVGRGVCRFNNCVILVPDLIIGEEAYVICHTKRKNYWLASVKHLNKTAGERQSPPCNVFTKCGGCSLQHINQLEQSRIKLSMINNSLTRIGGINNLPPITLINAEPSFFYRNKVVIPISKKNNNEISIGYYERNTNSIVDFHRCDVVYNEINQLILFIKKNLLEFSFDLHFHSSKTK